MMTQTRPTHGAPAVPAVDRRTNGHGAFAVQAAEQTRQRADQLAAETAREHAEIAAVRGPLTFQAINNQLVDAGMGLARLAGNDPKLKAAYTALQYVQEVIDSYAADEDPAVTAAVARFESLRDGADENMHHFLDLAVAEVRASGDPAEFASWLIAAVAGSHTKAGA